MSNINWAVVAAIVSAVAAALGLFFQRRDIKKQNRYQRSTFELQNKINENNLLIANYSKLMRGIVIQKENLYRWYVFKHEHQRYKRIFMDYQDSYEVGSGKYKDKIAIEELKNLKREAIAECSLRDIAFWDDYYEILSILEIMIIVNKEKKKIIKELNSIQHIFNNKALDIARLRFIEDEVPYEKIQKWKEQFDTDLNPHIKRLKSYFISSRHGLMGEISKIKSEK
ncbi:hypothetical protein ACI1UB_03955 [Lactococcus petauri]|uniref:hypothetical protein n=1 Tax=Lactococcus petauri TaxID=1940789 RepID=UPI003853FAD1